MTAWDDSSERAILSCLIASPADCAVRIGCELDPSLFFSDPCRRIFSMAVGLYSAGRPLNPLTLTQALRDSDELKRVGGAAAVTEIANEYVSPATLDHHLGRLREAAARRKAIEAGDWLKREAENGSGDLERLLSGFDQRFAAVRDLRSGDAAAAPGASLEAQAWRKSFAEGALDSKALRSIVSRRRQRLLADWFCESDLGFLFAARGVGKTWLSLLIARAVATGGAAGPWRAESSHPVLYIDGEMPLELMQVRDRALSDEKDAAALHYLNHEQLFETTGQVLNLTAAVCQEAITALCLEWHIKLLVLDNLSCLFRGVKENDADEWERVLPWLLDLRRRKIAVLFVCHAGRNAQMRGTSRREDAAAWVIRLDDASDAASARNGARFLSLFTKPSRNTAHGPPPLEWGVTTDAASGKATVTYQPAEGTDVVLHWVQNGLTTCGDIAREMGMTPGAVSKMATKLIEAGKLRKEGRGYALVALTPASQPTGGNGNKGEDF